MSGHDKPRARSPSPHPDVRDGVLSAIGQGSSIYQASPLIRDPSPTGSRHSDVQVGRYDTWQECFRVLIIRTYAGVDTPSLDGVLPICSDTGRVRSAFGFVRHPEYVQLTEMRMRTT